MSTGIRKMFGGDYNNFTFLIMADAGKDGGILKYRQRVKFPAIRNSKFVTTVADIPIHPCLKLKFCGSTGYLNLFICLYSVTHSLENYG